MRFITLVMTSALVAGPLMVQADQPHGQSLFKIERNKNANIIQYDAQIGADGLFDSRDPIVGYWIRLAEQGQTKELKWIERTFAYGFKAELDRETNRVKLKMVAFKDRPISVQRSGGSYQAVMEIDNKPSWLEKIYIHATGKGLSTKVDYADLYGRDLDSGDETYERFVP